MHRVLIVTSGPLCENPRPLKEAQALASAGYDVTVLGVRTRAATEATDRELAAGAAWKKVAIDMLPGFGTSNRVVWLRRARVSIARRLVARWGIPSAGALGPTGPLLRAALAQPADLTIVHTEAPLWVGTQLLRRGRRVAADLEDWHSEDLRPEDRRARPLGLLRTCERTLLNDAAYCSTTSNALADALQARYGGTRPVVVANSFPLQPKPHRSPGCAAPKFFWFSQTIGAGRGLEGFLDAWNQTSQPSELVLLGEIRPEFRDAVLQRVSAEKQAHLHFHPVVPPSQLPAVIAEHDIGLALEDAAILNRDLTITNKILQYLNAGLAVLATGTAGQKEVLAHAPGAGLLIDLADPRALAPQLDALLAAPDRIAAMSAASRRAAEERYCWEKASQVLLGAVANVLRAPPSSAR